MFPLCLHRGRQIYSLLAAVVGARPAAATDALLDLWASSAEARNASFVGRACGKKSRRTKADDVRTIIPIPVMWRVADAVLAKKVNDTIDEAFPLPIGCYAAGRSGTQPLDVSHGAAMVLERGLDHASAFAIAQFDVRQYFDNLPTVCACLFLLAHGLALVWVATAVRCQLLPVVVLEVLPGGPAARVSGRTRGCLTGSRLAMALCRIPIESMLCVLHPSRYWAERAIDIGQGVRLSSSAYVDNLYFAGRTAHCAVEMARSAAQHLRTVWSLEPKPDSEEFIVPRGASAPTNIGTFARRSDMLVLGALLSDSGHTHADFERTAGKMWRAFYANFGRANNARTGSQLRVADDVIVLSRAVRPILDFTSVRWPPNLQRFSEIQRLHRRMVGMILRVRRRPGEDPTAFGRRRAFEASSAITRAARGRPHAQWGHRWLSRVIQWDGHIERAHATPPSWPSLLRSWRGEEWLAQRRAERGSPSVFAGRTGTRTGPGAPAVRWHDGVRFARDTLSRAPDA